MKPPSLSGCALTPTHTHADTPRTSHAEDQVAVPPSEPHDVAAQAEFWRRKLNLKAEVERSTSHFGFKRSVPGGFNLGFIGQPAPPYHDGPLTWGVGVVRGR